MSANPQAISAIAASAAASFCTPPASTPSVPADVVAHGTGSGGECIEFLGALPCRSFPFPSELRTDFPVEDMEYLLGSGWGLDATGHLPVGSHHLSVSALSGLRPWSFSVGSAMRPGWHS